MEYLTYKKLLDAFGSVDNIYDISKSSKKFLLYLKKNNLKISQELYHNLISEKLKIYSKDLYLKFVNSNIKFLTINSAKYPVEILNLKIPPYVILYKGNISLLENDKVYIYFNKYFDEYGMCVYKSLNKNLLKKQKCSKVLIVDEYVENIKYKNSIILVKKISKGVMCSVGESKNLILFLNAKCSCYNVLSAICDKLVIPQARYEVEALNLTNAFLEYGKDIYVVPGNIYSKNSYFSNYLIAEGANVITRLDKI